MNSDFVYGDELGHRVLNVEPQNDFTLLITFTNNEKRVFDAKPLFDYKVFRPLLDKEFFNSVKTAYGTIVWPNGIDYCPDTLYQESVEFK